MATPSPSTPDRAASFGLVAEEYGRLRPAPQDEAIDWMLPQQASAVLDLAAGAGTLTALLPPRVRQVHAVEPDGRMRAVLAERLPDADVRAGTAEAIPLPDASVDAVIVASAWHWFDTDRAVPEIARVLRPGGRLGVVWNSIDRRVGWVDRWSGSLGGHGGQPAPQGRFARRGELLRTALETPDSPFGALEHADFTTTRRTTPAETAALLGTYSRVILLPEQQRRELLARALDTLCAELGIGPDDPFDLPFHAATWRTARRWRPARTVNGISAPGPG
ncbi:class I SAM-dependent methyltransferase [Actinacidiphila acidipaludis]|uniref:Class I SAM-dependent methyltransferase n=1 Tax=Actinacidiphila acidipaludis TaxID=2873382 RepID=A0ABS7QIH9_9ACTN|nr:class I SAM-dependent methyltransferase [Streptomyces acidipaludis]MBY8882601.1 class I SAM-dependent methyltransferase [Streptomyces acidipaludis]